MAETGLLARNEGSCYSLTSSVLRQYEKFNGLGLQRLHDPRHRRMRAVLDLDPVRHRCGLQLRGAGGAGGAGGEESHRLRPTMRKKGSCSTIRMIEDDLSEHLLANWRFCPSLAHGRFHYRRSGCKERHAL
jgi:hypothetical protein